MYCPKVEVYMYIVLKSIEVYISPEEDVYISPEEEVGIY